MGIRTKLSVVGMLLLATSCPSNAQDVRGQIRAEPKFHAWSKLSNGIYIGFATETEPSGAMQFALSQIESDGNNVHRVLVDKNKGLFFGYDVEAEPVPETKQIRVAILPLSAAYEQRLRQAQAFQARGLQLDSRSSSLFKTQAAQLVNDGDSLTVDLLVNQETGVKIVETIKVSSQAIPRGRRVSDSTPLRDFGLDDVSLNVTNYMLLINGELVAGETSTGGCSGPLIWFYMAERGRFIFSLVPHDGYDFQKVGVIEDNKISFTIGEERYQWISSSPVVSAYGRFNLWVLHDKEYRPDFDVLRVSSVSRSPGSDFKETSRRGLVIGAAGKIEVFLPKK